MILAIKLVLYAALGVLLSVGGIGIADKTGLYLGILTCVAFIDGFSRIQG